MKALGSGALLSPPASLGAGSAAVLHLVSRVRLTRLKDKKKKKKSVSYTKRPEYLQVIVNVKYSTVLTKRRGLGAVRLSEVGRLRRRGTECCQGRRGPAARRGHRAEGRGCPGSLESLAGRK